MERKQRFTRSMIFTPRTQVGLTARRDNSQGSGDVGTVPLSREMW